MGGDKVPTIFDKDVKLSKAVEMGLVETSWSLEGMHIRLKVEPHPCDLCVLELDLDPNCLRFRDCGGCSKEMERMTYVPPRLRRRV